MKKFEEFAERINAAKCPKDFFGELNPLSSKTMRDKISKETATMEKVCKIKNPKDNISHRIDIVRTLFYSLCSWAEQAAKDGNYDKCLNYMLKIEVSVDSLGTENFFSLNESDSKKVFFNLFDSMHFDGYFRRDPFRVIRKGKLLVSGYVNYYGTHGAREYFMFNSGDMNACLWASEYEEGDVLEIETNKFKTKSEFIKEISRFYKEDKILSIPDQITVFKRTKY